MLSLASFRYRNVLDAQGGPIRRLETGESAVLGERCFLANAYLRDDLAGNSAGYFLYSHANGSGTDASPMVARFKAISEALERWAHWELHHTAAGRNYGFDVDPSSNGMAAFPGLWRRQARLSAQLEAAERFNLLNWWEGRLAALESATRWPGVRSATICSEAPGLTVILYRHTEAGTVAYGHAAALDFDTACWKAAVEMERHAEVVERFAVAHAGKMRAQLPATAHPLERRSLFFAREEGHELFLERLRSAPTKAPPVLKLIFDGPVPGPWTRYADVWRTAYAPPSDRFLSNEENYFFL